MLELTNAQIGGWIASFVLPLFRVAALLMTMPVIGTQLVPVRVRLYLALGVCVVLVVNLAFGAMTRAAPQLNIFSIGFPLTLVLGLVILWIGTADLLSQYQVLAGEALQFLRELVRAK